MDPHTGNNSPGAWVLAAPRACISSLKPLVRAHESQREVRVIEMEHHERIDRGSFSEALLGADAMMFVGDQRRSPRNMLPGPFLPDAAGRAVPVGLLPNLGECLEIFARSAGRVAWRNHRSSPDLAILGQWDRRYILLADRMEANLRREGKMPFPVFRWTADRITRGDLVKGLRSGLGLAIYFGHGRPGGWAAYHGLRAEHLLPWRGEPLGAVFSVTCFSASRWRVGRSFLEKLVLGGVVACAVGAVSPVNHVDNMRWMLGLAAALRSGATRLGAAIAGAAPPESRARNAYRILGDPLAGLTGTADGLRRASKVWAPAPDELAANQ